MAKQVTLIAKIIKKLQKLTVSLQRLEKLDMEAYGNACNYNFLLQLCKDAEEIAVAVRSLPGSYGLDRNDWLLNTMEKDTDVAPISFESVTENIEKISFERLLPHRKQGEGVKNYLAAKYYPYIRDKYKGKLTRGKQQEKYVFCFVHYYKNEKNQRDYDNVETKIIQDIIAPFFIKDDSPKYLCKFSMSKIGTPHTELYIMPVKEFEWFINNYLTEEKAG